MHLREAIKSEVGDDPAFLSNPRKIIKLADEYHTTCERVMELGSRYKERRGYPVACQECDEFDTDVCAFCDWNGNFVAARKGATKERRCK